MAVYGKSPGVIDEQHPRHSRGNPYAHLKIEAEKVCEEFSRQGTPVIGLRPSIIYGPFSEAWTVSFAKRLMSGKWGTFGKTGEGLCNLVYITDVVQAIYRALVAENAEGEFFNVNGTDSLTWNEFFTRFNSALERPPLRDINPWPIAMKARLFSPVRSAAKFALARFGKTITTLHAKSCAGRQLHERHRIDAQTDSDPRATQAVRRPGRVPHTEGPRKAGLCSSSRRRPGPVSQRRVAPPARPAGVVLEPPEGGRLAKGGDRA